MLLAVVRSTGRLTRTLSCAFYELVDGGYAIVRQITMVSHGVQSRTWASLIGGARSFESMLAGGVDVLSLSIERWGAERCLSLRMASFGASLLKMLENVWVGVGQARNCEADERIGLHPGGNERKWKVLGFRDERICSGKNEHLILTASLARSSIGCCSLTIL